LGHTHTTCTLIYIEESESVYQWTNKMVPSLNVI
jgi:hypothetical protein